METILQNLCKIAISELVHYFAQLFAACPGVTENVHPEFIGIKRNAGFMFDIVKPEIIIEKYINK